MSELHQQVQRLLSAGVPEHEIGAFIQKWSSQPPQEMAWSDVASGAVRNFVPSAVRAAGEMWDAISNPWETAKAVGNVALGGVQKLIPGQQDSEKYADAVGEYFANRYGGMENFKRTLHDDPAGLVSELSALFTGGAGVAKGAGKLANITGASRAGSALGTAGKALTTAGALTDPLAFPIAALRKTMGAVVPSPERLYQSAIKPSTTLPIPERDALISAGIKERILPTRTGLEKMQNLRQDIGNQIGDLVDARAAREMTGEVTPNIIPQQIAGEAYDFVSNRLRYSPDAERLLNRARYAANRFENANRGPLDTATAQKIKQRAQAEAQKDFGKNLTTPEQDIKKSIARNLRLGVENNIPEVIPLNARLAGINKLAPEIERAVGGRVANRDILGLAAGLGGGGGLGAVIGSLGGPAGAASGAVLGGLLGHIARQPGTKGSMAFALDALRNNQPLHTMLGARTPVNASAYMGGLLGELERYGDGK